MTSYLAKTDIAGSIFERGRLRLGRCGWAGDRIL